MRDIACFAGAARFSSATCLARLVARITPHEILVEVFAELALDASPIHVNPVRQLT